MKKTPFVLFAAIFSVQVGNSQSCTWTSWMDRDNPSGTGDYERASDYAYGGTPVCNSNTPENSECRSVSGGVYYDDYTFGNVDTVYCTPNQGFVCINGASYCPDFEVRFCCPNDDTTG